MKRFVAIVSLNILSISNGGAQDNHMHHIFKIARFQATVAGKVCDTISREELLNTSTVDLNGYDDYKIVSFVCNVSTISPWAKDTANKTVTKLVSNSGNFTQNMYYAFQSLYGVAHICFTDIFCTGPDKKRVKLNDIRLALQQTMNIDTTGWEAWRTRYRIKKDYYFEVGINGKDGGPIRKGEMLSAGKLQLYTTFRNKVYTYNGPQIISYKAIIKTKKGYRVRYSDGDKFTPSIMYFLCNAKPGSKVIFRHVTLLMPDGTIEEKKRIVYKLKKRWFFHRIYE